MQISDRLPPIKPAVADALRRIAREGSLVAGPDLQRVLADAMRQGWLRAAPIADSRSARLTLTDAGQAVADRLGPCPFHAAASGGHR